MNQDRPEVLILDDEKKWLDGLSIIVESLGYNVIPCNSLAEAKAVVDERATEGRMPYAYVSDMTEIDPNTRQVIEPMMAVMLDMHVHSRTGERAKNFFYVSNNTGPENQNLAVRSRRQLMDKCYINELLETALTEANKK